MGRYIDNNNRNLYREFPSLSRRGGELGSGKYTDGNFFIPIKSKEQS